MWNTAFRRFSRRTVKGIWDRPFAAMSDDPDFECVVLDGTIVRVHRYAAWGKGDGTKFHLARRTSRCDAVCGLGRPVRVVLTAGQAGDAPHAHALIQSQPAAVVIAASPTTPTTSVTPSPPSGPKR